MDRRKEFNIFNQIVNDEPYVYLDSAASVPMPIPVQQEVMRFINQDYANVHRGAYTLAQKSSEQYEAVREKVKQFIQVEHAEEIVFTSGATASLNMIARSFGEWFIQENDEIWVSVLEHHANLVPWQELAKRKKAKLRFMPVNQAGEIDVSETAKLLSKKSKLIAVAQVSNVLGTQNPVKELAQLIHQKDGVIVVDGAQAVPHQVVDAKPFDFYVFSGHKMGAMTGTGILYGKKQWLDEMEPIQFGGDMIDVVLNTSSTWTDVPHKFEAGTPNILGVISLGASIDWLNHIGRQNIAEHVKKLTGTLMTKLQTISGVTIYGTEDCTKHHGIVSFNINGVHPHDVATGLDMEGFAVRAGQHCAQPLMRYFNIPSTVRASVYVYNTLDDIDRFIEAVKRVKEYFLNGSLN